MKGSFEFSIKDGVKILTAPNLHGIMHFFTTRHGGVSTGVYSSLNLTFSGDLRENVLANYSRVLSLFKRDLNSLVTTRQLHGDRVITVTKNDGGFGTLRAHEEGADAIITRDSGVVLAGFGADCVVALLYDPEAACCGVVHSGWRGTALRILPKTVSAMAEAFGSRPHNILAALGPSIGPCCFETDSDVPGALSASAGFDLSPYVRRRGEKFFVDLAGINSQMLVLSGLLPDAICCSGMCTACGGGDFWSHRRSKGLRGVQGAFIMLP